MVNASSVERLDYIGRLAVVILYLITVNLVLQHALTDFWRVPIDIQTKLGVTSYELLILIVASTIVMSPSYFLFRFGNKKTSLGFLAIASLSVAMLQVSSWLFYRVFERFLGAYAIQMLFSDANQIWGYLFKLPSMLNPASLAGVVIFLSIVLVLVASNSRWVNYTRRASLYLLPLVCIVSLGLSTAFNTPEAVGSAGTEKTRLAVESVRTNEYSLLKENAGPFSGFSASALSSVILRATDATIDTSLLRRRKQDQPSPTPGANKRNVVFIVVESMRPDALEVYGEVSGVMPTVDELAKTSYVFNRAYSQASHSNYAYVSAMSGQYPLRSMNIHFYPENPTYPKSLPYDVLKPLGYNVGLFGSHNDNWGNMSNYLDSASVDKYSHVGSDDDHSESAVYEKVEIVSSENGKSGVNFGEFMYQSAVSEVERLDEETVGLAIDWLEDRPNEEPFFMYLNLQAAHQPFDALPEDYERKFLTDDTEMADKVRSGVHSRMPVVYVAQAYMDALYYVDSNIKTVVDHLKSKGVHDNTIYVVTSDTSLQMDSKMLGNGGDLDPEVIRIPMVFSVPEKTDTEVVNAPVEQIDIMPTVLSLVGVEPHPASQGVDVISQRDPDRLIYSIAQTPLAHQYSVIYRGWQLLHDHNKDTYEIRQIEGVETQGSMDSRLSDWMLGKLNEWKRAQIAYYSDESVHGKYYPPRYNDPLWKASGVVLTSADDEDL